MVIAARPETDFTLPGNTCLPAANALFTNSTTISDGTLPSVIYTWNFGDGTVLSTQPVPTSPSHTYAATGSYTVTLTATSVNGCTRSVSKTYDKVFAQPVAVITAPAGGVCLGNVANFSSASSTAPSSTVNGWSWILEIRKTIPVQHRIRLILMVQEAEDCNAYRYVGCRMYFHCGYTVRQC